MCPQDLRTLCQNFKSISQKLWKKIDFWCCKVGLSLERRNSQFSVNLVGISRKKADPPLNALEYITVLMPDHYLSLPPLTLYQAPPFVMPSWFPKGMSPRLQAGVSSQLIRGWFEAYACAIILINKISSLYEAAHNMVHEI